MLVLPHAQPDAVPLLVPSESQRVGRPLPVHSKSRWWILGCCLALALMLVAGLVYSRRPKDLVEPVLVASARDPETRIDIYRRERCLYAERPID